jgi:hypothetical protein
VRLLYPLHRFLSIVLHCEIVSIPFIRRIHPSDTPLHSGSPALLQAANCAFNVLLTGNGSSVEMAYAEILVEYGLARFYYNGEVETHVLDEPIAFLSFTHSCLLDPLCNPDQLLIHKLLTSEPCGRGFHLEYCVGFLVLKFFATPTPLSLGFTFHGDCDIADLKAHAVALRKDGDYFEICPFNINSAHRPGCRIGASPRDASGFLDWLQNPDHQPLCFPSKAVGPDVILVLQLSNGDVLYVIAQVRYRSKERFHPGEIESALVTTDPKLFFSEMRDVVCLHPATIMPY